MTDVGKSRPCDGCGKTGVMAAKCRDCTDTVCEPCVEPYLGPARRCPECSTDGSAEEHASYTRHLDRVMRHLDPAAEAKRAALQLWCNEQNARARAAAITGAPKKATEPIIPTRDESEFKSDPKSTAAAMASVATRAASIAEQLASQARTGASFMDVPVPRESIPGTHSPTRTVHCGVCKQMVPVTAWTEHRKCCSACNATLTTSLYRDGTCAWYDVPYGVALSPAQAREKKEAEIRLMGIDGAYAPAVAPIIHGAIDIASKPPPLAKPFDWGVPPPVAAAKRGTQEELIAILKAKTLAEYEAAAANHIAAEDCPFADCDICSFREKKLKDATERKPLETEPAWYSERIRAEKDKNAAREEDQAWHEKMQQRDDDVCATCKIPMRNRKHGEHVRCSGCGVATCFACYLADASKAHMCPGMRLRESH
jgi:hypothetical protein